MNFTDAQNKVGSALTVAAILGLLALAAKVYDRRPALGVALAALALGGASFVGLEPLRHLGLLPRSKAAGAITAA